MKNREVYLLCQAIPRCEHCNNIVKEKIVDVFMDKAKAYENMEYMHKATNGVYYIKIKQVC